MNTDPSGNPTDGPEIPFKAATADRLPRNALDRAPLSVGADAIANERCRQIRAEGWTEQHDDGHTTGDLVDAALCYAAVAAAEVRGSSAKEWPVELFDGFHDSIVEWPFDDDDYKPSNDPIKNLIKAGALIAAEIDRLHRATVKAPADNGAR